MIKASMNPSDYAIDGAYDRLKCATLNELSRLIPCWHLCTCDDCSGEVLILRSADHPNALMIAAGKVLAERLGITEDCVSWQPLELQA
jgi:hypothetical protein